MYVASPCFFVGEESVEEREREAPSESVNRPSRRRVARRKTKTDAFAHLVFRKKHFSQTVCSFQSTQTRDRMPTGSALLRAGTLRKNRAARSVPYPRLGGGYAAIGAAFRFGRAKGGARETPARAESSRAAGSAKRRDTYLEALGQGVVTGKVGLEPRLGLDVRAGGVLGRLARTAAAAAAMWKGDEMSASSESERSSAARRPIARSARAIAREAPSSKKKPKRA